MGTTQAMTPTYDTAVVIGRFAPFDIHHAERLSRIGDLAKRVVILVCAAEAAPSCRMPWTAAEREAMLRAGIGATDAEIGCVDDHVYLPEAFTAEVIARAAAQGTVCVVSRPADVRPEALAALPQVWTRISVDAPLLDLEGFYGDTAAFDAWASQVPEMVKTWLEDWRTTPTFTAMAAENRYVGQYLESWKVAPYPVCFVAVDIFVIHADPSGTPHLLLVRRGGIPGRGQWALPGGYLEPDESLLNGALRELQEETGMVLSPQVVAASFKGAEVFAEPDRASRGRVITHAHRFVFEAGPLPVVEGADDAEHAVWTPLSDLAAMRDCFFEDHYPMIEYLLEREA